MPRVPIGRHAEPRSASAGVPTSGKVQSIAPGALAQRSEQGTHNPLVLGSNPRGPTAQPRDSPRICGVSSLEVVAECSVDSEPSEEFGRVRFQAAFRVTGRAGVPSCWRAGRRTWRRCWPSGRAWSGPAPVAPRAGRPRGWGVGVGPPLPLGGGLALGDPGGASGRQVVPQHLGRAEVGVPLEDRLARPPRPQPRPDRQPGGRPPR